MPANDEGSKKRNASPETDDRETAVVEIAFDDPSDWTVSPSVFGKFTEMNAREGYPGIYSEHVANGSFEEWYTWPKRTPEDDPAWWRRSELLYRDTEPYPDVAYPWEPILDEGDRATFEHPVGGRHGRDSGTNHEDVHGRPYREPEPRYQRITVWDGRAGVRQRLALPDERVLEYDLAFDVRGSGLGERCEVAMTGPDGRVHASETVGFEEGWERHELTLELDGESDERYRESPFGEFALSFAVEGQGHVDLDWVRLRAGDAVNGKFNPTTITNLREYDIPCIRWPGGNFVSQYSWRDGVGPHEDRPVRSELHWGGLEENYLGVDEFLAFCEHADVEPYLNVGFSNDIGPEEAAAMVEYVNGDPETTELGALRADHGHEEPWDIDVWQVGNEVWGEFQIGHTDAAEYADRYVEHYEAMKAVDPSITVMAVGLDPGDAPRGGNEWNETLFERAGDAIMGIDIHRYVHGDAGERDWDPTEFNQQLVLSATQFERNLREAIATAADTGTTDLEITVGEWNMGAGGLDDGPRARYGTMAHAAFCAGMYNAFLRQGEAVRYGHQRDNAFKHRPYPADLRPMHTANNAILEQYTAVLVGDDDWHLLPTAVEGPTGHIERNGERIEPMDDVSFVDATAVRTADAGTIHVFATNRDLTDGYEVAFDLPIKDGESVAATVLTADDPLDARTGWSGETSYEVENRSLAADGERVTIVLPPAAFVRLDVDPTGRVD